MLNYFDPKELGLRSGTMFSPRDVASFNDVGYSAIRVANECLSKISQRNGTGGMTEALRFRSDMGWASQGKSIMMFGKSDTVKTAYMNASRHDQLHWGLPLGHKLGDRSKSTTGGVWRRDRPTL